MRKLIILSTFLALALVPALHASTHNGRAAPPNPPLIDTGLAEAGPASTAQHIVVRFKEGVSAGAAAGLHRAQGMRLLKRQDGADIHRLAPPAGTSLEAALAAYRRSPLVAEANVGHIAQLLDTPNDTNYSYQWHLNATDGGMWANLAWDLAPNRGQGVVVAVVDTGVAYEAHSGSLNGNPQTFQQAPDLATTPFVAPWDFNNNDAHPNDDHGHGSHVAGTISQDTNNFYGVAGVAHNSTIMPLKVLDHTGNGNDDDIVEAIYHAVANGADVINMSLGFPGTGAPDVNGVVCTEIVGLNAALDFAHAGGVVLVAAAGNDGGIPSCPAAHPAVISTGAFRFDGAVTFYSNRGPTLDISAPGGDPYIDQNGDGYSDGVLQESFCYDGSTMLNFNLYGSFCNVFQAGTSMASPHVAGTVALLLGEDAILSPDQVRTFLESTARDYGAAGRDDNYGWGALDAAAALAALKGVPKPTPTPVPGLDAPTNLTATAISSNRIDLAWTDNASAEAGFKLERSTDGVNYAQIAAPAANTNTYSNTSLTATTTYHYRVRAYSGANHSAFSNVATATTLPPPAAPSNLTATATSSSRIALAWTDNANNEAGFKLDRSTDGVNFANIGTLVANTTSYTNPNLAANTTYHYRIRAYEGTNYSAYSSIAFATTQPAPAAPSNLTAVANSTTRIDLNWTDNATNETYFRVERSTNGVNFAQIAILIANATSFSNTGLSPSTTYYYRALAFDTPNYSQFSNVASAATQAAATPTPTNTATPAAPPSPTAPPTLTPTPTATPSVPAAPSNLTATAVSSSKISLTWTDNATNESGFKIDRSTDGVSFSQVAILTANKTSYSDTNLSAATTRYYRIRAYVGANNSPYSNIASATTQAAPAAPTNLKATATSKGRISVTWTDDATNEAGFKLERSTDGVTFTQIALLGANTASYNNGGLTSGATYYYRVRAYDGPNHSEYSNIASAVPK